MSTLTDQPPHRRIMRMPEALRITGLSRSTFLRRMKDDPAFPKKVNLSSSTARSAPVGFVESEVLAWVDQRIKEREAAHG